jgi:hypothetical protein
MICDRRAMEIDHLAWQMKDFAVYLAANGENSDPNITAILKAKVNELTRVDGKQVVFKGDTESRAGYSQYRIGAMRFQFDKGVLAVTNWMYISGNAFTGR